MNPTDPDRNKPFSSAHLAEGACARVRPVFGWDKRVAQAAACATEIAYRPLVVCLSDPRLRLMSASARARLDSDGRLTASSWR